MKQGKRALGSVFLRASDGRWVARVTLPDGKRVTRYAASKAEAEGKLAALLVQASQGEAVPVSALTVGLWLDQYLERANRGRAAATVRDRKYLAAHIRARLGRTRLDRLTPAQVQTWADTLTGSHRTRLKSLQLLRGALNEAVALGHLPRNAAAPVKLERHAARMAGTSWTQEQARAFLTANADTAQAYLWTLALQTGARIGELLALRLGDYDPVRGTLRIERTVTLAHGQQTRKAVGPPKTASGHRTFPLPPDARATLEAQLARREELKRKAGAVWQEQGWLFPSEVGTLLGYDNVRRAWRGALDRAQQVMTEEWARLPRQEGEKPPEFPRVRTHDMRVTFISLALKRGVKPEVVSRMVGHSSPLITLRIYRQVFEDEIKEAGQMVARLI